MGEGIYTEYGDVSHKEIETDEMIIKGKMIFLGVLFVFCVIVFIKSVIEIVKRLRK